MKQGYTSSELIVSVFALCIVVVALWTIFTVGQSIQASKESIKIETVAPTDIHIISEFSTGYLLVEMWTTTQVNGVEINVPHIVRITRSEYIKLMNPVKP